MAKSKQNTAKQISNRQARRDYDLKDGILAGIALTGRETKSLRRGHGQLRGAYVTVKDGELWLINATITTSPGIIISESEQTRARKLLLKHREIAELIAAKQQGRAIIPLEILTRGRYIKVRIAIGQGRKRYDKRQILKKRDEQRDVDRAVKRI
jgi:SsrA-binding protein